jgi:DNA-binding CsgD family transcriptional regulator
MLAGTLLNTGSFVFAGLVASASNIVALIAIAVLLGRCVGFAGRGARWPAILAAAFMLGGSAGNLLGQALGPSFRVLEFGSLALASGGYVLLTVLWGRFYASRDSQDIETYAVWATFLCAILYLLALVIPAPALVVLWLCLPPASCVCLLLSERQEHDELAKVAPHAAARDADSAATETDRAAVRGADSAATGADRAAVLSRLLPYWWFALSVLVASFCITLPTGFHTLSALPREMLGFTTLSGLVFAAILVIYCIVFARRINLATFYRVLCPLTVGGLFLIALSAPVAAFMGFGLIFAAQWVLYLSVWIYLAELCHRIPVNAILVFAVGRLMFELGFLLAYLLSGPLTSLATDGHTPFVFIAFGIAVFFVLTTLLPLNADETQDGTRERPTHNVSLPNPVRDSAAAPLEVSSDREMIAELFQKQTQRLARRYALSPRESEIVQYLIRGYSLPSIRNELFIAKSTIDSHVQRIYRKCDIHSRQDLITLFDQITDDPS